jgi:hypothetical protein
MARFVAQRFILFQFSLSVASRASSRDNSFYFFSLVCACRRTLRRTTTRFIFGLVHVYRRAFRRTTILLNLP